MKTLILNRISIILGCVALLMFAFANNSKAQSAKTTIVSVIEIISEAAAPNAGASLSRNNAGVFGTISTSGLTPGDAVTLWWVIFNNPSKCATSPCDAPDLDNPEVNASVQNRGGRVIGVDGRFDISGFLSEGDNTGFVLFSDLMPNPAPGIVNATKAEIHMILVSHGSASADPDTLKTQLTTLDDCGGDPDPCVDVQFAVFDPRPTARLFRLSALRLSILDRRTR